MAWAHMWDCNSLCEQQLFQVFLSRAQDLHSIAAMRLVIWLWLAETWKAVSS
jgi:hypothetical protein